jgi:hypothetical protein
MRNLEQLVTFETAKLAKEKGFDWPTDKSYNHSLTERVDRQDGTSGPFGWKKGETNVGDFFMNNSEYDRSNTNWYRCSAPTQSLLQKWLFEVHGIWVSSTPAWSTNEMLGVNVGIFSDLMHINVPYDGFDVYEALEMGLNEALKSIKYVEEQFKNND